MSLKGRPTQYLGHCQYFKDQSLFKKKDLMNSAKICFRCLGPMKDCRTPEDPETCSKQLAWDLKCKHCNSTSHHSLICPTNPTPSHQTDTQYDNHRGEGGEEEVEAKEVEEGM